MKTTVAICCWTLLLCANARVEINDFFPFGRNTSDHQLAQGDDTSSNVVNLDIAFPFFNMQQRFLYVNVNGGVSFANPIGQYTPTCGPVSAAFSMVAPFWGDVDSRLTSTGWSGVFYREDRTLEVLAKANLEVRNAFGSLFRNIELKWAFVATWFNVTYFGCCLAEPYSKRNSFQATLATNGEHSFAIFYYGDITWTTGTASRGNCSTGLGGFPAKAGFDAGDGKSLLMIPSSCTDDVVNIEETSNVGSPGKWVFRIDSASIVTAGCTEEFKGKLRITPSFSDLNARIPIELVGPCIDQNVTAVECVFHDRFLGSLTVEGWILGELSSSKVVCYTPFLHSLGLMSVDLVLFFGNDSNANATYSGSFYSVTPTATSAPRLTVKFPNNCVGNDLKLDFSWDSFRLENATLVNLFLYRATALTAWEKVLTLAENVTNSGSLSLGVSTEFLSVETPFDTLFNFGIEPVDPPQMLSDNGTSIFDQPSAILFSDCSLQYLAWRKRCEYLNRTLCQQWYLSQPTTNDSLGCPPTEAQMIFDPRYEIDPDGDCYESEQHSTADRCYRRMGAAADGSSTHCCYGQGALIPDWGCGVVTRWDIASDYFGGLIDDSLGFLFCCYHSSLADCALYHEKRPCGLSSRYVPPIPSGGLGDPHITTFDGLEYTFNGYGEYWMLKPTGGLTTAVQARMEPYTENGERKNGTVFSAFVFGGANTTKIQVQRSPVLHDLQVFVNDAQQDLDDKELYFVRYDRITVIIADDKSRVTIGFTDGVSFIVTVDPEAYSILTAINDRFNGSFTSGLLGKFDGQVENDLMAPNGTCLPTNATLEQIHWSFGELWRVSVNESMFYYGDGNYSSWNDPTFTPSFAEVNESAIPAEVREMCEGSRACLYDYAVTGSETLANITKAAVTALNDTSAVLSELVVQCAQLVNPANGQAVCKSLAPGSLLQYTCFPGFELVGDQNLVCSKSGTWLVSGTLNLPSQVQCLAAEASIADTTPSTVTTTPTTTTTTTTRYKGANSGKLSAAIGLVCSLIVILM